MSKKIFINNLNTFVSEQLMAELRNDGVDEEGNPNPDANLMFGTFIDKDSSEKPDGIKKMLKRSKPRLAMKYLSECDLIIYDLHAGNPQDVRLALEALKNTKFEEPPDKTLILVSSLMAWSGTDKNKEEIKTAEQLAEEAAAK
jgi:UDP-N-acetylmuramyl pentapeptide synthase